MRFAAPLLIDVDEVLLNWTSGFRSWMASVGHESVGGGDTWSMLASFPSVPNQTTLDDLMLTFSTKAGFGDLKEIDGAAEGLGVLRHIFPDSLVVAVTSCGASEETARLRRNNLRRLAMPVDQIITLPLHSCKKRVYASFRPGIVIDDAMPNLYAAKTLGHRAVAFDQPWNKTWPDHRLYGWAKVDALFSHYRDI